MNIARELGSLLSGLLAPQAPTATRQTGKNLQDRARTSSRDNQRTQSPAQAGTAKDRITLSNASRALQESTQAPSARIDAEPASHLTQSGQPLALPYLSASSEPPSGGRPSAAGMAQAVAVAESPATRQLVRTTYGSPDTPSNDNTPLASRIDLRA